MSEARAGAAAGYFRFLAAAILASVVAGAIGYLPTVRLAGVPAVEALLAGSLVALLASALGGVPIALAGPEPVKRPQAVLLATVVRLVAVVGLGLAAVATGWFAGRPLVVWIAIGYGVQLVVDSRYSIAEARRQQR